MAIDDRDSEEMLDSDKLGKTEGLQLDLKLFKTVGSQLDAALGAKEGVVLESEEAAITLISCNSSCLEVPNKDVLTSSLTEVFLVTPNTTVEVAGVLANLWIHTRTPSLSISKCSFLSYPYFSINMKIDGFDLVINLETHLTVWILLPFSP